ncbi:50S ribosomal protein L32 [Candidatus Wolfebacteria bacterium]|nr:MAG: 50S ribosomal protein L32 [Candidatus Wolfebacteria bacterium]
MTVRMRHTRSHTANRRSHHALKGVRTSTCSKCGSQHIRHQTCATCGTYRGRQIIDVVGIQSKKLARKAKRNKDMGLEEETPKNEEKALDANTLSKK